MTVVPDGMHYELDGTLLNKDKGFVREGQEVRIKLDAFPYTRYGTLSGKVVSISNDAVSQRRSARNSQRQSFSSEQVF
ncbi:MULTISPECIES: HlyD family secretion protein [unclassified Ensifer]|uniref:HlyD family efflux transporter periplasmic adaptor subunit n=1 Tax=unclassified Ensifer TaxID=2633371 RepID=UPI00070F70BC|nr:MULTISPECIES: HlyD family secretion protein [unclassified Ensifer]KQW33504.1 hypothetical protein ASD02_18840 [Ensifer sp. Root1252]KRC78678.1 hypothetical protein ASE32_26810 [Ensifer sp. Root231]KRD02581.1 hypothetical protein ASE47_19900 [Ensifer sp. Root258]